MNIHNIIENHIDIIFNNIYIIDDITDPVRKTLLCNTLEYTLLQCSDFIHTPKLDFILYSLFDINNNTMQNSIKFISNNYVPVSDFDYKQYSNNIGL
jgi:hypothetical protein